MATKNGYYSITSSGSATVFTHDVMVEKVIGYNTSGTLFIYDTNGTANIAPGLLVGSVGLTSAINTELKLPVYTGLTVVATALAGTLQLTWSRAG